MGEKNLIKKLVNSLEQASENVDANAAVVVLLKETNQKLQVLFVKRAKSPKDAWSGQIALPGGKRDPKDFEIKTTVVRETLEETGLNLLEGYRFLGTMEPLRSVRKPEFKIVPFVVLQTEENPIKLNEELTEYFWMPISDLAGKEKTVMIDEKEVPAYKVNSQFIWGLTYNIMNNLISLLTEN